MFPYLESLSDYSSMGEFFLIVGVCQVGMEK